MRKKVGCVTMAWCCFLFMITGVCFWVPFCVDSCKDTECVCHSCGLIKTTIPANCCWFLLIQKLRIFYQYLNFLSEVKGLKPDLFDIISSSSSGFFSIGLTKNDFDDLVSNSSLLISFRAIFFVLLLFETDLLEMVCG